jgi:hypothetical protein
MDASRCIVIGPELLETYLIIIIIYRVVVKRLPDCGETTPKHPGRRDYRAVDQSATASERKNAAVPFLGVDSTILPIFSESLRSLDDFPLGL